MAPAVQPTPSQVSTASPTMIRNETEPEALSSLTVEEACTAIQEAQLPALEGKRVAWVFVECSPFQVLQQNHEGANVIAILPVRDAGGSWFAIEAGGIVASENPDEFRGRLTQAACRVEGMLAGALEDGFIGPGWQDRKTIPILADVRLSFIPFVPPVPRTSGGLSAPSAPSPSPTPTRPTESPLPSNALVEEAPAAPEPTPPRYEIQLVPERERVGAHASGREFAWSLRHTLYENDDWILDEREYRLVEEWDRAVRSRYQTFENPKDRQAIVREFVQLLGEEKAMHAGILFNDNRGLPIYRWPPAGARLPPLPTLRGGKQASPSGGSGPLRRDTVAREGGTSDSSSAEHRDSPRNPRVDSNRASIEERLLEFLFEASDRTASILFEARGGRRSAVKALSRGVEISLGEKERRFSNLAKLLTESPHQAAVFRLKYPLFDRIALKFGPPERRRSGPYPRDLMLSSAEDHGRPAPGPATSLVWEAYGGVEVARAKIDEESDPLSDKMVLVRIDLARWRQPRR
ncbi:MAG: hypothetical protein GHCLOJNM_03917 [bacterium]|nr:hypothetical protein [bacterium]